MDDYVVLELNASKQGWICSGCGLFTDSVGRPQFGHESWTISCKTISWIENKPQYRYCPGCGKPLRRDDRG